MKRMILIFTVLIIGLSAKADYTVQTVQPIDYSASNPYFNSYYNSQYYQNPYQAQCQGQYIRPCYRNPYYYGNNLAYPAVNSTLTNFGTTGGSGQIVKNIGRSVLFSLMRGY